MIQSSIELKKTVNLETISGYEYKQFIDMVWNMNWNKEKKNCQSTVEWLGKKQNNKLDKIVQTKRNVNKSNELEAQVKHVNKANKNEENINEELKKGFKM